MKKFLISSIFISSIAFSSENYELKLYEKIFPILFKTDKLIVYADNSSKRIFRDSNIFTLTSNCEESTLIIGKDFEKICENKPIFTTSYRNFENLDNSFGVFYWRNGVPKIRFNLFNVKKFNLFLPQGLKKYAK